MALLPVDLSRHEPHRGLRVTEFISGLRAEVGLSKGEEVNRPIQVRERGGFDSNL